MKSLINEISSLMYMPIYLNEELISAIYSLVIEGLIESKEIKFNTDKTDSLKLNIKNSESIKKSKNEKEDNKVKDISTTETNDFGPTLDGKFDNKMELKIKKIYTKFYLFHDLRRNMINRNILRRISEDDIINNNISSGEYVEFDSNMTSDSAYNGIINLIDILNMYTVEVLDKLLEHTNLKDSITNYTVIKKQLENLKEIFKSTDSANVVMRFNNCKAVLELNLKKDSFSCQSIYKNSSFPCKVLCKVLRCIDNKDSIDLLDKTGMADYCKNFINSLDPYLEILKNNNVIVPENILTEVKGPAIQVIPLCMYV